MSLYGLKFRNFCFPLKSYDKVRNLSKWCPFCVVETLSSVSHLSDFDAYKEYESLYCRPEFQRKNRDSLNY